MLWGDGKDFLNLDAFFSVPEDCFLSQHKLQGQGHFICVFMFHEAPIYVLKID